MASDRISVRIPDALAARLRAYSRAVGTSESDLVREALEKHLTGANDIPSAYELAQQAGIIGTLDAAPDLSTNRRYFKGFGKNE